MRPYPAETIPEQRLLELRLLAADIDDTLTRAGKLRHDILHAIGRLRAAGVVVWLVTGRSGSWGQALSQYLEVDGVIAENGGVICRDGDWRLLADEKAVGKNREKLAAVFAKICRRIPGATPTSDNVGRLTDWTFQRQPLSDEELALVAQIAWEEGIRTIASSIHVHLFAGEHTKATALLTVCRELDLDDREKVLVLGDSPNDEPFFNADFFPFSAAVANIENSLARLEHKPLFILSQPEAEGALWLIRRILVCKGR